MSLKYTIKKTAVTLTLLCTLLTAFSSALANDYSLAANPNYSFPGSTQGATPPPPQTGDMAAALQSSFGVSVTIVNTMPFADTAFPPKTADYSAPPNYAFGPASSGRIQNLQLGTTVVTGIVSGQLMFAGVDQMPNGVNLNRYILRAITSTKFYDVLLKVTGFNGSGNPNDYYGVAWSFQEVSAPRNLNALLNISARAQVLTGQNVLFTGFYISGSEAKKVLLRGIGPSLSAFGITGALSDPYLELRDSAGTLLAANNNWQDTQASEIQATGAAPSNYYESAIVATLNPGSYTTTLTGVGGTTGIATCEVYDINQTANSQLVNLSARALVGTGNNALFAGLIIGGTDNAGMRLIVRAIGPSLSAAGISNPLQNPTLELRDVNGSLIGYNNNWRDSQQTEISATGVAPSNDLESAIVLNLQAGYYTAIARGLNDTTGVGVIDSYKLQ